MKDYFAAKMLYDSIKTYELFPPEITNVLAGSKLIVNTTSIGMDPDVDDSATTIEESFNSDQIVFDVIYNPLKTKFLKIAESRGAIVLNGFKMFIEQGAKSFELWTGESMNLEKVSELVRSKLTL